MKLFGITTNTILILALCQIGCRPEKNSTLSDNIPLLIGQVLITNSLDFSFLPEEVLSVSPEHKGKSRSAYVEDGVHFQSNACQFDGVFQLERIVPSDPITISIVYKEDISSGTIELLKNALIPISGTVTRPNARTIQYVSDQIGDLYAPYRVNVRNVSKTASGESIQDATWTFHYDLSGVRGDKPSEIVVNCQETGGVNECAYVSKFALGAYPKFGTPASQVASPQSTFAQPMTNFESHFGLQRNDADSMTLWMYERCEIEDGSANIPAVPAGKFLFAKIEGVGVFDIPRSVIEGNQLYTGSILQSFQNQSGERFGEVIYPEENIHLITNQN
ncbi:hypothetical protein AB3N59_13250 [Leptospira sp. WS92.C1]